MVLGIKKLILEFPEKRTFFITLKFVTLVLANNKIPKGDQVIAYSVLVVSQFYTIWCHVPLFLKES